MPAELKLAEYYAFTRWIAIPRVFRQPLTQKQWEADNNISAMTISRWKKDPNFWEDVAREAREWAKEFTPDVYASVTGKAIAGDMKAAEIFLTHFDNFTRKSNTQKQETHTIEAGESLTSLLLARAEARAKEISIESTVVEEPKKDNGPSDSTTR